MQVDGSYHPWLGNGGPRFTLLLAVDDATGTVANAVFRQEEDTRGYFDLMEGLIPWPCMAIATAFSPHPQQLLVQAVKDLREAFPSDAVDEVGDGGMVKHWVIDGEEAESAICDIL